MNMVAHVKLFAAILAIALFPTGVSVLVKAAGFTGVWVDTVSIIVGLCGFAWGNAISYIARRVIGVKARVAFQPAGDDNKLGGSDAYYLQNGYVGNDLLFWRKGSSGYSCHLNQAEVFTWDEIQEIIRGAPDHGDVPWPKSYVDARASRTVDQQDLDHKEAAAMMPEVMPKVRPRPKDEQLAQAGW